MRRVVLVLTDQEPDALWHALKGIMVDGQWRGDMNLRSVQVKLDRAVRSSMERGDDWEGSHESP
jgi:hypothetical protein